MSRKKRNKGWFKRGHDPRRSNYRPTREECQRGHAAALEKMMDRGWDAHSWFFRRVRGWYRTRKRGTNGAKENGTGGSAADVPF